MKNSYMPRQEQALPGREEKMPVPKQHYVNGHPIQPPFPAGMELAMFGLGCFWGAERKYWETDGVYTTMVGYAGGSTSNPTYQEVCTGMTGHNEVVRIVYEPNVVSYETLLKIFWTTHDPTQGMRQGNDVGTEYRSGIYCYSKLQQEAAEHSKQAYQKVLENARYRTITTEIMDAPEFYYAEEYHQQYLAKTSSGYCGLGGTGVSYPESHHDET